MLKKLSILVIVVLCSFSAAYPRDYVKLQVKETKHAQKYDTAKRYFENINKTIEPVKIDKNITDPKILRITNFEKVDDSAYKEKLTADEKQYQKFSKDVFNRYAGEDYYKLYRVAERLIRANRLDYLNWRITIYRASVDPNAYNAVTNYIAISSALFDTYKNDEDALAYILGHEMGHAVLGHNQRLAELREHLSNLKYHSADPIIGIAYKVQRRRFLIESKNMEYAADVEGAKMALKAGYNINNASKVLSYFDTLGETGDYQLDHPISKNRLKNVKENRKYFLDDEWTEYGKYNIFNSKVLKVTRSTDYRSVVLESNSKDSDPKNHYAPESMDELLLRLAYKSYTLGELKKSVAYFNKYLDHNCKNAIAYLYASYANYEYFKETEADKYKTTAIEFIKKAQSLDNNNKYIKEQAKTLNVSDSL